MEIRVLCTRISVLSSLREMFVLYRLFQYLVVVCVP